MSIVKSFSVGNGDMFCINHNSDNFTIIDCKLSADTQKAIVDELKTESNGKGITRFISTHPDDDHICGLVYLDDEMSVLNFYVVENEATKDDQTDDFERYCELRDHAKKAFHIYKGCERRWMNLSNEERQTSGIQILWPDVNNQDYKDALADAADGCSPNNISAIVKYGVTDGPSFFWMGDLETDFMQKIEGEVEWPEIDILFAPHHGRDSGTIPDSILAKLNPKLIVIGEAPSEHLNYYAHYDTITQNSAGDITFDCVSGYAHVYVSDPDYTSGCLSNQGLPNDAQLGYYVGSVVVAAKAQAA